MSLRYEISGCPVCGATSADTVTDADGIRRELEELWAFHIGRLRGDMPAARLHDRIAFSQTPPLRVARCCGCGLLYRNPREKPETLVELYRDEHPDPAALEELLRNQRAAAARQARRLTRLVPPGRGLEVGSYVGAFLAASAREGWSFEGVDVNEAANGFARARGGTVLEGTLEDVTQSGYDAVAFWNCFDQLPDPAAAARRARTLVRTGGLLGVRVPNGSFYARWRRRLDSPLRPLARALLAHNNLLGFPYRHGFTSASLQLLLEAAGFDVVLVVGDSLVPTADRWTRFRARAEEAVLKTALRALPARSAPWLEVYARAR